MIYSLNTLNEDNAASAESRLSMHQSEVRAILEDAKNKVKTFRDALQDKQTAVDASASAAQLGGKLEAEKKEARANLKKLADSVADRDRALSKDVGDKLLSLRDEVQASKNRLSAAAKAFELKVVELDKAYEAKKGTSKEEVERIMKIHAKEMQEHVQEHNGRYNAMLVEQLASHDKLKKDLAEERRRAELAAKDEHERTVGKLRATLAADATERVEAAKREAATNLEKERDKFAAKIDKAIDDIKGLRGEIADRDIHLERITLEGEIDKKEIKYLRQQIEDLNKRADEQNMTKGGELQAALERVAALDKDVREVRAELQRKEAEASQLRTDVARSKDDRVRAEKEYGEEREKLRAEIEAAETTLDKNKRAAKNELEALSKELEAKKKELDKASKAAEADAAAATKTEAKLKAEVERMAKIVLDLEAKLADAKKAMEGGSAALNKHIEELKKQMDATSREHELRVKSLQGEFEGVKRQLEDDAVRRVDAARKDGEDRLLAEKERGKEAARAHEEKLRVQNNEAQAALEAAERAAGAAAKKFKEEAEAKLKEWELERSNLNRRIADLSKNSAAEAEALKGEGERRKKEALDLQTNLNKTQAENKQLAGITADLKKQIDELRRELEDSKAAAKTKMEQEIARITRHYDDLLAKSGNESAGAMVEMEAKHRAEMDSAVKKLRDEFDSKLEKEVAAHKVTKDTLSAKLEEESANCRAAVEKLEARIRDLEAQYSGRDKDSKERHAKEVADLRLAHEKKLADMLAAEKDGKEEALKRMQEKHQAEQEADADAAKTAAATAARLAKEELGRRVAEKEREKKEELERLRADVDKENQAAMNKLKVECEVKIEGAEASLKSALDQLSEVSKMKAGLEVDVAKSRAETDELRITMSEKERELLEQLERVQRKGEEKLAQTMKRAGEERQLLMLKAEHDMQEERSAHELVVSGKESEIEALHERYAARESRPEDLQRIAVLEREMVDKDALVKKTKEEMVYFKRELINREENFNQKFGSNPNVGVMSVIKPQASQSGAMGKDAAAARRKSAVAGGLPPQPPPSGPQFGF